MKAASLELPVQVAGKPKSFSQQGLLLCNLGVGTSRRRTFQSFWSLVRFLGLHSRTEGLIYTVTEQPWVQIMTPLLINYVNWASYLT